MMEKAEGNNFGEYEWIMDRLKDGTIDDWEWIAQMVPDFPCAYKWIMDRLKDGTVDDWELFAQMFSDFPCGLDDFIHRHWITNAIDCGSLEAVKWMISKGVNLHFVDDEGYSPLHSCIDRTLPDKYEILQLLIDSGADINIGTELETQGTNGWTPLHMASVRNDIKAVKILLDSGADCTLKTPIDDYATAEQEAAHRGNHEIEN